MSFAESVMDEIKNEQPAAAEAPVETTQQDQPTETPAETPVETSSEDAPPQETVTETVSTEVNEDKPEEKPEEKPPVPKPDLSQLTKEQKAEHAFARQLAKQKEKHQAELDDIKKTFQSQFDDLKKQLDSAKAPERIKTREDFPIGEGGDDAYISYLSELKVNKILAERDAAAAKAAADKAEEDKKIAEENEQRQQMANYFYSSAKAAFGEGYADFEKRVQKGVDNGLADVLDEAPAVRDYIFGNPDGPAVLNEMLLNKDAFVRIMSRAANPINAVIECHDLARELASRTSTETQQPRQGMPPIGKPGAGAAPSTAPDMWKDDRSLIDFVRSHR